MILDKIKERGEEMAPLEGHDRLQYLVDKAKEVEPLPDAVKTENNRIHGCASKLWIIGGANEDNKMQYRVDGDAFITKGTESKHHIVILMISVLYIEHMVSSCVLCTIRKENPC